MSNFKICKNNSCKQPKKLLKYFSRQKQGKGGYRSQCVDCERDYRDLIYKPFKDYHIQWKKTSVCKMKHIGNCDGGIELSFFKNRKTFMVSNYKKWVRLGLPIYIQAFDNGQPLCCVHNKIKSREDENKKRKRPDQRASVNAIYEANIRFRKKEFVKNLKIERSGCECGCNYKYNPDIYLHDQYFEWDHLPGYTKVSELSYMAHAKRSNKVIKDESFKCQVLLVSHHKQITKTRIIHDIVVKELENSIALKIHPIYKSLL